MKIETIIGAAKHVAEAAGNRALLNELEGIQYYPDYAEPGYSCDRGIVAADWNTIHARDPLTGHWDAPTPKGDTMRRLERILERAGYAVEWSDEWCACSDCGRALRASADCMHWARSYVLGDGEILCADCAPSEDEGGEGLA